MAARTARLALLAMIAAWPVSGSAEETCGDAILAAEQANPGIPAHLLRAIGLVESGRADPETGRTDPWPWSVNAAGEGHVFENRDAAVAFVEQAVSRGIRSIDVGCMQVNLMYHPFAFASLSEAFSPSANVRYATAFLLDLYRRTGDWTAAAGYYHSATPGLAEGYAARVGFAGSRFDAGGPVFGAAMPRVYSPSTRPSYQIVLRHAANLPRVFTGSR